MVEATDTGARLPTLRTGQTGRAGVCRCINPRTATAKQPRLAGANTGRRRLTVTYCVDGATIVAQGGAATTRAERKRALRADTAKIALKAAVERARIETIRQALGQAQGNVAEAAAMLGILRTSLYRIMKRDGIAFPSRAGR